MSRTVRTSSACSSGVGMRTRARGRSADVAATATELVTMTGVNVEASEATTAPAKAKKAKATSAKSISDPAGVIKTSSGRIVKRNAKYYPGGILPARVVTGNEDKPAGILAPKKRWKGRAPKNTSVPSRPPRNSSGSSASKTKNELQLSLQNNLPRTQPPPSTSTGAGGTTSTSFLASLQQSSMFHDSRPTLQPPPGQPPKLSGPFPTTLSTSLSTSSTSHKASTGKPEHVPIPPVPVEPPQPPNFQQHLDETLMALVTHKTFPVDNNSMEFIRLKQLISPLNVISAEQIVNPDLWQRFNTARKEMLRTKSSDLNLISKLFPLDKDVLKAAQLSLKFNKDPRLTTEQGKYSPNEALLCHCIRDPNNLENILSQGLDERLGNQNGLFGRGIYFTDSPTKASYYDRGGSILICAVLLGDCLTVSHQLQNRSYLVREPEKGREQQRSWNDKFFDAITSSVTQGHNEFIIYNRYQCYPLYLLKYRGSYGPERGIPPYSTARSCSPAMAWLPEWSSPTCSSMSMAMPDKSWDGRWPFFAHTLFRKMGVTLDHVPEASSSSANELNQKIKCLVSIGFPDEELNRITLEKYENDLNKAVEYLMEHAKSQPQPSTAVEGKGNPTTTVTIDSSSEDEDGQPNTKRRKLADRETCDICCVEYASFARSPELWKELKCRHRLCLKCHNRIETTRSTMAGLSHTFTKCSSCQMVTGTEVGTCPNGQMQKDIINVECSGYPGIKTIRITYDISTGLQSLHRIAYLPYNKEGYVIMKLLETAWDRRICFMIGTSITTGQQNVPVWNIQHKTSTQGGPQNYGYPDPGYFKRVREELKAYGIE